MHTAFIIAASRLDFTANPSLSLLQHAGVSQIARAGIFLVVRASVGNDATYSTMTLLAKLRGWSKPVHPQRAARGGSSPLEWRSQAPENLAPIS
jgi:hypothetical protein